MRRLVLALGSLALVATLATAPARANIISTLPGGAIPDGTGGLNINFNFLSSETLLSTGNNVTLSLNNFIHTWAGDLVATLTHLDTGSSADIFRRPGGQDNARNMSGTYSFNSGYTTDFDTVLGSPMPAGNYFPADSFSIFNGESAGGTWRLRISDRAVLDTSNSNWTATLSLQSAAVRVSEPSTLAMLVLAALALCAMPRFVRRT